MIRKGSGGFALQALFHLGIYSFQQFFPPKIGTRIFIWEIPALLRLRCMNETALAQFSVEQKNTGAVFFDSKSITFMDKSPSYLSVADIKIAGNPVNIRSGDEQDGTRQVITTEPRAIIAIRSIGPCLYNFRHTYLISSFRACPGIYI